MEYDLVSIWMLDSLKQGISLTQQDLLVFQGTWGKKTFGQLLNPLQKNNWISEEIKEFLEQLRLTRNRLMHVFFIDSSTNLLTKDGRKLILAEAKQIGELLEKGHKFFSDILETYLKDFGVDAESIRKQILKIAEDIEPEDEI
jgi:hypothetical protein